MVPDKRLKREISKKEERSGFRCGVEDTANCSTSTMRSLIENYIIFYTCYVNILVTFARKSLG